LAVRRIQDRGAAEWYLCRDQGLQGFLAGGLAGASVALLLAPQSGKVTREAMRRKARETNDSARGLKDRVVLRGEELRDETARRGAVVRGASPRSSKGGEHYK